MHDIQTASSLGNLVGSTDVTVTVSVPVGRVPVSAGFKASNNKDRGVLYQMYLSAADTYTFKFGGNSSGLNNTVDFYVYHVPVSTLVTVGDVETY